MSRRLDSRVDILLYPRRKISRAEERRLHEQVARKLVELIQMADRTNRNSLELNPPSLVPSPSALVPLSQHTIESRTFQTIGVISDLLLQLESEIEVFAQNLHLMGKRGGRSPAAPERSEMKVTLTDQQSAKQAVKPKYTDEQVNSISYKMLTDNFSYCCLQEQPKAQFKVQLRLRNTPMIIMVVSVSSSQLCLTYTSDDLNVAPGAYSNLSKVVNYLNGASAIGKYNLKFTGRSCIVFFEDLQDYTILGSELGRYLWNWIQLVTKRFNSDLKSLLMPCLRNPRQPLGVFNVLTETKKVLRKIGFPNFKENLTENSVDYTFGIVGFEASVVPVVMQLHSDRIVLRVFHSYRISTPTDPTFQALLKAYNSTCEGRCDVHADRIFTEFVNSRIRLENWGAHLSSFIKTSIRSFCNSKDNFAKFIEEFEASRLQSSIITCSTASFASN